MLRSYIIQIKVERNYNFFVCILAPQSKTYAKFGHFRKITLCLVLHPLPQMAPEKTTVVEKICHQNMSFHFCLFTSKLRKYFRALKNLLFSTFCKHFFFELKLNKNVMGNLCSKFLPLQDQLLEIFS